MEHRKSLLTLSAVNILPNLSVRIPTVGEILDNESFYYSVVTAFTATPFQYMVWLDDMGIDYTKITEYELFKMIFLIYKKFDLSLLFGDLHTADFEIQGEIITTPDHRIEINEQTYHDLADTIRKINVLEKVNVKPGNDSAQKYLLEKERKKQKRTAQKSYHPYLEKLVIALVNTSEFPYHYDSCMNLSIYRFNQSLKQIQHKMVFDKTMTGIYAGTIDPSKLSGKDTLSWIRDQ